MARKRVVTLWEQVQKIKFEKPRAKYKAELLVPISAISAG